MLFSILTTHNHMQYHVDLIYTHTHDIYLGGNLGTVLISFMVPTEVPIHKYFSEPQNYNPDIYIYT